MMNTITRINILDHIFTPSYSQITSHSFNTEKLHDIRQKPNIYPQRINNSIPQNRGPEMFPIPAQLPTDYQTRRMPRLCAGARGFAAYVIGRACAPSSPQCTSWRLFPNNPRSR